MLHLSHLSYQISCRNQLFGRVAAGHDNVKRGLRFARGANLTHYLIDRQHVIAQHVNQFVENKQVVCATPQLFNAKTPGITGGLAILFRIPGVPGEAVAHGVNFNAELFCRNMLAVTIIARLHELDHAATQTLPGSAHHQAESARGFAFSVSSVNDEEAASLFLIVGAAPFVFAFDRHLFGLRRQSEAATALSMNIGKTRSKAPSPLRSAGALQARTISANLRSGPSTRWRA